MGTVRPMVGEPALVRLMAWLSPSFPVGAYAWSHGLEFAVEEGLVHDGASLTTWVEGIVSFGAGRLDADLLRRAWEGDDPDACVAWGNALRGTAETAAESRAQGRAFVVALRAGWPDLAQAVPADAPYAVAVGRAAAAAGVPLRLVLAAFLHAMAANLVSAGVRLVPLGQTAGVRAIADLEGPITAAVDAGLVRGSEDLGAAAVMVDWTSARHETQYTRLFRS